jgi:hypothetical protein
MNRILRVEGDWLRGLGWDFWSTFLLYVSSLPCILVIFQSLLCVCDWLGTIRNELTMNKWTEIWRNGRKGGWTKILERGLLGFYQKVSLLFISHTSHPIPSLFFYPLFLSLCSRNTSYPSRSSLRSRGSRLENLHDDPSAFGLMIPSSQSVLRASVLKKPRYL